MAAGHSFFLTYVCPTVYRGEDLPTTGLLSRILSLPRAPTEVVVDKEPADAASTFLSLLRDGKRYDFPIGEDTQSTGLPYKRGKTA
jgi:hypothetical protein